MNIASSPTVSASSLPAATSDVNATAERSLHCSSAAPRASSSHHFAQQLNNSAALCIEIGNYSRAITSLQKALELNKSPKKGWKDRGQQVCKCYQCTLDACIDFSESTPSEATTAFHGHKFSQNNKKRRKICLSCKGHSAFWKPPAHTQQQQSLSRDKDDITDERNASVQSSTDALRPSRPQIHQEVRDGNCDNDINSGGYIYRRPIRIRCEGHAMGSTLYLIMTFNLALAHHLQTVRTYANNIEGRAKEVNRTLVLYELTYKWQLKLLCARDKSNASSKNSSTRREQSPPPCTAVTSIRFNMMIRNNLSQIHRLVGNHSKHKRCLEHLLSTVMVVTEYKSRTSLNRVVSNNTKDPRHMELDGFLQNTTALILREGHCANAA